MNEVIENVSRKLDELGIEYELEEHEAVFTIDEMIQLGLNKKGEKHTDIKKLQEQIGCTRLSFGSEERLMKHLGLAKGSVSPFGLINNTNHDVEVIIDESIKNQSRLGFHPNTNTATLFISYDDFMKFIKNSGNPVKFVNC